jgi:hypothetical protein
MVVAARLNNRMPSPIQHVVTCVSSQDRNGSRTKSPDIPWMLVPSFGIVLPMIAEWVDALNENP